MKKKNKNYPSVQFGTSLMLVIFMILCLTAFAVLSLSSALRNYDYSQKAAAKTYDYYKADGNANCKLAEIDQILKDSYHSDLYPDSALEKLEETEGVTIIPSGEDSSTKLTYQIPVNERQSLNIQLSLHLNPSSEHDLYSISSWKEISVEEWNSNTTLPVIGSD